MMLSAIAPRKDSAQSTKEGPRRQSHDHATLNTLLLAKCSNADIVTNDERAKPEDVMRVLSPMRPRRTPKLVNAPDVKWRIPSHLQHMPSADSLLSSMTSALEASTVRKVPVAPQDIALPLSSASSIITTLPHTVLQDPPLPLSLFPPPQTKTGVSSPAPQNDTRFNEARVTKRPRAIPQLSTHQPHYLSPVTEASSAPSIRSSIADLRVEEVGIAECHQLSDIRIQNVHIVDASKEMFDSGREQAGEREERYSNSIQEAEEGGNVTICSKIKNQRRDGIRGVFGRLRKSVKHAARKVVETVAKKYVVRVLAKVL